MANKDYIPIGYVVGQKQLNYLLWVGSPHNRLTLFGYLTFGKTSPEAKAWYCPSEPLDFYRYNTGDNPWPPGVTPTLNTRAGYGCRPVVDWPNGAPPPQLPKLKTVKNLAILADIVSSPARVNERHKNGVNVLYGHGGAYFVNRAEFNADLKNLPETFPTTVAGKAAVNPIQDNVWNILDVK